MAEVTIKENVWQELTQMARVRHITPEALTDAALREFLRREADEDLLRRSARAAHTTDFPIGQTEEIIRQNRRRKRDA